jgi:hypothetical protein
MYSTGRSTALPASMTKTAGSAPEVMSAARGTVMALATSATTMLRLTVSPIGSTSPCWSSIATRTRRPPVLESTVGATKLTSPSSVRL